MRSEDFTPPPTNYPATFGPTPAQTVGPFLHIALPWSDGSDVVPDGIPGRITIVGQVLDGDGVPMPDAMIETWQADPDGRFDHPDDPRGAVTPAVPGFRGFGRAQTTYGDWMIHTVKPGPLPTADGELEAPHLDVAIFARGMINHTVTRIYFPDEEAANAADPVLSTVDPARRHTLIATREGDRLRFDIRIQGEGETVFFEF